MPEDPVPAPATSLDPSLDGDDDDQDEDFVASELGDSSSDEGSDLDSDDDSDGDGISHGLLSQLEPDVVEAVRRALLDDSVALHEEEILSDSELSRQFPDEADDEENEVLFLLGDQLDQYTFSGTADSDNGREDSQRGGQSVVGDVGANSSKATFHKPLIPRPGRPGRTRAASKQQQAAKSGAPAASEVASHLPEDDNEGVTGNDKGRKNRQRRGDISGAAITSELITSVPATSLDLSPSDVREMPIAQRTRAHMSLTDVPIEELELDKLDEPFLHLGVDDQLEYRRFLEDLNNSFQPGNNYDPTNNQFHGIGAGDGDANSLLIGGLGTDMDDDSDDEDFLEVMQREFLGEDGMDGFLINTLDEDGQPIKKRGRRPRPKYQRPDNWRPEDRPKYLERLRLRDTLKVPGAEANRRSTRQKQQQQQQPMNLGVGGLIDMQGGGLTVPLTAAAMGMDPFAALDNLGRLASAATLIGDVERPLMIPRDPSIRGKVALPSDLDNKKMDPKKTAEWRQPLPAAIRKKEKKTGENDDGSRRPGVSIEQQQEGSAPAGSNSTSFHPRQCRELHRLLHQHLQLLVNVHLMAVNCGPASVAESTRSLLTDLLVASSSASSLMGHLPFAYPMGLLGCVPSWEMLTESSNAGWEPIVERSSCTVMDVGPLRLLPAVLEATSAIEPPRQQQQHPTTITTGALSSHAGQQQQQQQLEQQGGGGQRRRRRSDSFEFELDTDNNNDSDDDNDDGNDNDDDNDINPSSHKRKRKKKGKTKPRPVHKLWRQVPQGLLAVALPLLDLCDPGIFPQPPDFISTSQILFTPAEDKLLAWGIRRYLYDWKRIQAELLPGKTEKQMFTRKKNRVAKSAPNNPIKSVVAAITGPLTSAEIKVLTAATKYYGKQPRRWEVICRQHLPHRQPQILATLWSEYCKKLADGTATAANDSQLNEEEEEDEEAATETDSGVEAEVGRRSAREARQARIALRRQQRQQQQQQGGEAAEQEGELYQQHQQVVMWPGSNGEGLSLEEQQRYQQEMLLQQANLAVLSQQLQLQMQLQGIMWDPQSNLMGNMNMDFMNMMAGASGLGTGAGAGFDMTQLMVAAAGAAAAIAGVYGPDAAFLNHQGPQQQQHQQRQLHRELLKPKHVDGDANIIEQQQQQEEEEEEMQQPKQQRPSGSSGGEMDREEEVLSDSQGYNDGEANDNRGEDVYSEGVVDQRSKRQRS